MTRAANATTTVDGRLQALLPWAALALLAFLVYLPALGAGYSWDDDALTANPAMKSLGGLWKLWTAPSITPHEQHYWPLVYSSFWLEYRIAGLQPFLYHLDNVLLHGATCLLLWRVLRRLAVPGAWLAAALFAVHPVHAESVAWVIERKDVLSGVFYFGSALAFLHFHELPATESRHWKMYALALGLFAAALLSKSIVVTLPFALGIALWWRHGRLTRRDLLALAPLVLLAVAATLVDLLAFFNQARGVERSGLEAPERVMMAGRAIWVYLAKLAWPWPLATFYPKWAVSRGVASALPGLAWLALLAGLWLGRRRLGRGAFAALAFFSLTIAPALGVIDFEFLAMSWIADRFQYLASAGPLVLAAGGAALLAEKRNWPAAARRYGAAALLALLGVLCLRQAAFYRDPVTLFRASADAYPECWATHNSLRWAMMEAGRADEAIQTLAEGMRRMPKPDHRLTLEMAKALDKQQRPEEAEPYYQEALRQNPQFVDTHICYGVFLAVRGDLAQAEAHLREAVRLRPDNAVGHSNLGNVLRNMNKLEEAAQHLAEAVRLAPGQSDYRVNLALTLLDLSRYPEAARQCQQALALDPEFALAHQTMGQILLAQGQGREAMAQLETAARLQPQAPDAYYLMGRAHQALGELREAAACYQQALSVQPNFAPAAARLRALQGAGAPGQ